ncbi:hypothetical protein QUF72_08120 [Desulfobacterales bacterium HSG2]|nr:hypothetical protein [Desulfobacterales bacterium HSG2]
MVATLIETKPIRQKPSFIEKIFPEGENKCNLKNDIIKGLRFVPREPKILELELELIPEPVNVYVQVELILIPEPVNAQVQVQVELIFILELELLSTGQKMDSGSEMPGTLPIPGISARNDSVPVFIRSFLSCTQLELILELIPEPVNECSSSREIR